ncbi:MAG: YggS family pyridoxal phosphate-dependent enzyme [Bacteroidales bacterium]|nr:YggS family pyridoxal phosphate-dependent enzyme [Bacteroidales bacterium]
MRLQLPPQVTLVAVSKFHPSEAIREAWAAGQRVFAESRPQELAAKVEALSDCPGLEWQFIGHLQTNKLKMVLPYVSLVQSVDSQHLLDAIEKWAASESGTGSPVSGGVRKVSVLLEMHVALEESKQGFYEEEILDILMRAVVDGAYKHIRFCGLMGMATNTDDAEQICSDFTRVRSYMDYLQDLFPELTDFKTLSIGMSADFPIAVECGSTMVRIGSAIFGERG